MAGIKKDPKNNRGFFPSDRITIGFIFILSVLDVIFISKLQNWQLLIAINALVIYLIWLIVKAYEVQIKNNNAGIYKKGSILRILRYWYPVVLILYIFKQVYYIIYYVKPADWDIQFIQLDRWIFGTDLTSWSYQFANPVLTEFLQIIYMFYYISIVVYALELYLNERYEGLLYATFIILLGFYISYIGYLIFPAIGPRFHLHSFQEIGKELPGLILTEPIRWILNFAESIPAGLPNPSDYAQRDAMPSAHTVVAVILAYLSHSIRSRSFYFYLPYCVLLIISTIYLRYHYAVDIIAGIIVALIAILLGNYIYKSSGKKIKFE